MVALGETILDRPAAAKPVPHRDRCERCVETPGGPGTAPLVNNLYQGMAQDPVTGLYYERARWYSPSLGTWISQDPAGYINGADTYQFVGSDPVGNVDPAGSMWGWVSSAVKWADRTQLQAAVVLWNAEGWKFAASLLESFLSKSYPSGNAHGAFQQFAQEIKSSGYYRHAAWAYLKKLAKTEGPGRHPLAGSKTVFNTKYYRSGNMDLLLALGGAHFGFSAGTLVVCGGGSWHTEGLRVFQRDKYAFPPGLRDVRELVPVYQAASELQYWFHYPTFWHREHWADGFSSSRPPW